MSPWMVTSPAMDNAMEMVTERLGITKLACPSESTVKAVPLQVSDFNV